MSRILYVDISLLGHRKLYLKELAEHHADSIALIPGKCTEVKCKQIVMTSGYDGKRSWSTYLKWLREIQKIVLEENIDVVHLLCGDALYRFFGIGLEIIQVPLVVTYHHMLFGKVRTISLRNIFRKTRMGIVHTEHLKKNLNAAGITNVTQIEYPVFSKECEMTPEEAKEKIGLPIDIPCIVVLGGTQKYKGLDILLEALKKVEVPFWLHVTGLERAFSKQYIIENSQFFRNRVSLDMVRLSEEEYACALAATDILVLPYRWEFDGASGPMIEGVWNRKYIVGSSHGSMGEIIRKYNLGKTFKTEDPEDLARVLNEVLQSKRNWSDAAEAFRKNLTVDEFVKHNDEIYELI